MSNTKWLLGYLAASNCAAAIYMINMIYVFGKFPTQMKTLNVIQGKECSYRWCKHPSFHSCSVPRLGFMNLIFVVQKSTCFVYYVGGTLTSLKMEQYN